MVNQASKSTEPIDISKLIARGDSLALDLTGRLARMKELDKRTSGLLEESTRITTETQSVYDALLESYRSIAKYAGQRPGIEQDLTTRIEDRDRKVTLRDRQIVDLTTELSTSRDEAVTIRRSADRLKVDLAAQAREIESLRAQLKGRDSIAKGENPTEAYVRWVKSRYKPLFVNEAPAFVAYDRGTKVLDAAARFLLYSHAGINVILDGPTGSGKSTLMEWAAFNERKPMHSIPPVRDISLREVIGEYAQDGTLTPGPVPLFLIFGGYLGFDEVPNLNPKVAIALHSLLQGKPYRFETHMGPVDIDPDILTHHIAGSGNFAYQKPNFNPATLQRLSFMDLPALDKGELGKILSGSGGSNTPFDFYINQLKETHPWFFSGINVDRPYQWMARINRGSETVLQTLTEMMLNVRETVLSAGRDIYHEELDLSPATLKRSIALYSDRLDRATMRDIVAENVVNPIAVMYPHQREEKAQLTQRVHQAMDKYLTLLRMR